jgi:predicted transcriptional regulator
VFGELIGGKTDLRPSASRILHLLSLELRGLTTKEITVKTNYKKATVCLALKSLSDANLVSKRVLLERDARTYVWFALSRRGA